jgi:hypothetical protein
LSLPNSKSVAEAELLKASADVSRTVKALEEQIDMFEKKKLQDIKSLLLAFVTIELSFHTKAIEFFTKSYQYIADIDEDEDLEVKYDFYCLPFFKYKDSMLILNTIQTVLSIMYTVSLNMFLCSQHKNSQYSKAYYAYMESNRAEHISNQILFVFCCNLSLFLLQQMSAVFLSVCLQFSYSEIVCDILFMDAKVEYRCVVKICVHLYCEKQKFMGL